MMVMKIKIGMMIDDDDTLGPLVSPPDRASFELPRAPDIGSCKPPFQCAEAQKV